MLGPPDDPKSVPLRPWHTWTSVLPRIHVILPSVPPTCVTYLGKFSLSPHVSPYLGKCSLPPTCVILPGQVSPSHMCISSRASIFPPHLYHSTWTNVHPFISVRPNMSHYLGSSAPSPSPSPLPLPSPGGARAASSSACAGATNTAGRRASPEALHAGDDNHSGAVIHSINCMFL